MLRSLVGSEMCIRDSLREEWAVDDSSYVDDIIAVCEEGRHPKGANKVEQLRVFCMSDDIAAGNNWDMRILRSMLSDCESTIDAVMLAVGWRESSIIQRQLEESTVHNPQGLSDALTLALLNRDVAAVRVLIAHNARCDLVDHPALWKQSLELVDHMHAGRLKGLLRNPSSVSPKNTGAGKTGFEPLITYEIRAIIDVLRCASYENHLDARRRLCMLTPTWTDLMLWAVVVCERKMAECLWERTENPIRPLIVAARVAQTLALNAPNATTE